MRRVKSVTLLLWKQDVTNHKYHNSALGFISHLDLLVIPTPIPSNNNIVTHHFEEPMRKPTKTKTKAIALLLSTLIQNPLHYT